MLVISVLVINISACNCRQPFSQSNIYSFASQLQQLFNEQDGAFLLASLYLPSHPHNGCSFGPFQVVTYDICVILHLSGMFCTFSGCTLSNT